tara:strand:- start:7127 stop:9133 length:2007 start_codon:yes stop_codon:yes gene_type:complete
MLSISSDIDSTSKQNFHSINREIGSMSNGFGLEFANSVWYKATGAERGKQIAFIDLHGDSPGIFEEELNVMARRGEIDSLHTYGNFSTDDFSFTRKVAEEALKYFSKSGIKFPIWVNHGDERNSQNLAYYHYMEGDIPESESYHVDLMMELGVKYIWDPKKRHNFSHESLLEEKELRDGTKIWSFPRYHVIGIKEEDKDDFEKIGMKIWNGVEEGTLEGVLWVPQFLHIQLKDSNLRKLVEEGGHCIITQHLGYIHRDDNEFTDQAKAALSNLSGYFKRGEICVTRTSRQLEFNRVRDFLNYEVINDDGVTLINILSIDDPVFGSEIPKIETLRGIQFTCEDPENTYIAINGVVVKSSRTFNLVREEKIVGFPWKIMEFEDLEQRKRANNIAINLRKSKPRFGKKLVEKDSGPLSDVINKVYNNEIDPLICIGGMKCGTTSLWKMFQKWPGIVSPVKKEPSYFGNQKFEDQSIQEYLQFWDWSNSNNNEKYFFESSTHYAKFPAVQNVPAQMKAMIPNAKIIYMVRNPYKRIVSQLAHHVSRGEMTLENVTSGKWASNKHLFALTDYATQLDQYAEYFSKENILILPLEGMIGDFKKYVSIISNFLGIDTPDSITKFPMENKRRKAKGSGKINIDFSEFPEQKKIIETYIANLEQNYGFDTGIWNDGS